ncbi:copper resistance protein CopC [soil metagenome]
MGRLLLALGLAALVLLAPLSGTAGAHAMLEGGSLTDGQVVDVAPEELFLAFNEDVQVTRSGLRVYDPEGQRVDVGGTVQDPADRSLVRVAVQEGLDEGTYAVTYRVVSADGHPVSGAFVFSVGAESGAGDALLAQVFSSDADRPYAVAAIVARWVMYAGVMLAAGAALVLWWLRREITDETPRIARLIGGGAVAVLGAAVLGFALQIILTTGDGVQSLTDGGALAATLGSFYGIATVVRIVGATALLVHARKGLAIAPLGLTGAGVLLTSLLLEGHTISTGPAAVIWPAAVAHVATAALWSGGLVVMAVVLRSRRRADDPVGAGRLVARFSAMFTISVVAVVLAGSALSWVEVRALRAVFSTTYGLVLAAKVGVVLPLLALGIYNNRRLVPVLTARRTRQRTQRASQPVIAGGSDDIAIAGGSDDIAIAGGSDDIATAAGKRDAAWSHLRRTVGIEIGIIAVVLGLTGVLVGLQPAAVAAGVTGAYSENVQFEGIGQMTFTVDPNRSGRNEIHLYLLGDTGRPVDVAESVSLRLVQPDLEIGPLTREPILAGPGHYILAGPELSVPGRWQITVEVALNRFDVVSQTVEVTVNP